MTDRNTERTRQTLEALAMVDYWRNEAEQQRTRAEAAEQELRDERDNATVLSGACRAMQDKLAAIRAHLPAIKRLHAWVSSDDMGKWTYLEGGSFYDDVQEMTAIVADALEALEP